MRQSVRFDRGHPPWGDNGAMITIGHAGPDASPDDPIGWIEACHARIAARLATLERLAAHHAARGADTELIRAIKGIVRYFDEAAPNHHADEDVDLFPRLRSHALARGDSAVAAAIDEANAAHGPLEAAWDALRPGLLSVDADRGPDPVRIEAFASAYRAHLQLETGTILEAARLWLGGDECRELGAAMARRRGIGTSGSAVFIYPRT